MKNFLLICCISITALAPAKAQVSKHDFDTLITMLDARPAYNAAATILGQLNSLMTAQINYVSNKFNDKQLNAECDRERRQKAKDMGACDQLQNLSNTLNTEKTSRDAVLSVTPQDFTMKKAYLIRQLNIFKSTLQ